MDGIDLQEINDLLRETFPEAQIFETSPQLINNMICHFMKHIIKLTNKKKSEITKDDINTLIENIPELRELNYNFDPNDYTFDF